jgi:sporulation protein YlmC with PRC-barrel domain
MGETRLTFGDDVRCTDGVCGHLHRIIVEPGDVAGAAHLTHLAVGPDGLHDDRLVPADLIASAGADILLRCDAAAFQQLEGATETAPEHTASWPYPDQGPGARNPFGVEGIERDTGYGNRTTTRDRIPAGGVETRRGEPVYAVDGEIGRIRGLIVDLPDRRVTGLLIIVSAEAGHFHLRGPFGEHRGQIVVPAGSVQSFGDGIQLDLTRDAIRQLPYEEDE